jgi:hypothetical protein
MVRNAYDRPHRTGSVTGKDRHKGVAVMVSLGGITATLLLSGVRDRQLNAREERREFGSPAAWGRNGVSYAHPCELVRSPPLPLPPRPPLVSFVIVGAILLAVGAGERSKP